jgi:hypothetical protein
MRAANLSKREKPALSPKQCSRAGGRLSGVEEDSAVGKPIQKQERPWTADGVEGQSARVEKK